MTRRGHHKGNKLGLPSRPCAACGREMTWRKRWARSWAEVKYCSAACRRRGAAGQGQLKHRPPKR